MLVSCMITFVDNADLQLGKRRFEGDADGQKYDNYLLPGLNYTRYEIKIGSI